MMMALGLFVFALPTLAYQDLKRRNAWKHAGTPRIGAADAYQYVGPGEETVALSGAAYAELCDGRASLDELRQMAGSGQSWSLIDGGGYVWGSYIIQSIDEGQSDFFADGTPRKIDFGIELLLVDQDPGA